jgi:hypothetical protein
VVDRHLFGEFDRRTLGRTVVGSSGTLSGASRADWQVTQPLRIAIRSRTSSFVRGVSRAASSAASAFECQG